MSKYASRILPRFALPAVLVLAVLGFGSTQTSPQRTRREGPAPIQALLRHAIPGTRDLQLVIELSDPPAAVALGQAAARSASARAGIMPGRGRLRLDTREAMAYRAQIAGRRKLVT